jgi:glycerophosphoryl diester phosphodiesterase
MPKLPSAAVVCAALLLFCLGACAPASLEPVPEEEVREDRVPVPPWTIAHRGASAYAPENTIPAFLLGADQGAAFIEIDLQRTKDGQLVVLHDLTLDRTTNVEDVFPDRSRPAADGSDPEPHWWLEDFTFDEVRQLDAGSWFDAKFAGTRIPSFDEVITALRGRSGIFIELKSPERYPGIEAGMMAVLERHGLHRPGADPATPIVIQSFHVPSIERLSAMGVQLPLHVLFSARDADRWLSEDGLQQIRGFATGISPEKPTLASGCR